MIDYIFIHYKIREIINGVKEKKSYKYTPKIRVVVTVEQWSVFCVLSVVVV